MTIYSNSKLHTTSTTDDIQKADNYYHVWKTDISIYSLMLLLDTNIFTDILNTAFVLGRRTIMNIKYACTRSASSTRHVAIQEHTILK